MKIVTLYAGEENTRYFAVHDRKHISPLVHIADLRTVVLVQGRTLSSDQRAGCRKGYR